MNLSRLDLNLLVFLDVLLRENSVTRAAEQVGITQPAMSNALARLRQLLDDPLLVREGTRMKATARALELQHPLREALSQLHQAVAPAENFDPSKLERTFTLLITDYAEQILMPCLLGKLLALAPGVQLNLVSMPEDAIAVLQAGKADAAINWYGGMPEHFYEKPLWEERQVCICRQDHPALRNGKLSLKNYLKQGHCLVTQTGIGLGQVDRILADQGLSRHIAVLTRRVQQIPRLVAGSDLVAVIPNRVAEEQQRHYSICILPPPVELNRYIVTIGWGPVAQHDPAHRWLRELAVSCMCDGKKG